MMMGIPPALATHMPIGRLAEIVDASLILKGYMDESLIDENSYIDIELK